ncbi:MAG: chromosome partitioning protein ParB, partial [Candidatus Hodarchaeales archaeon]
IKTLDFALHLIQNNRVSFVLIRKSLTKKDVIDTAKQKIPLAPKTTRHILSWRYQDIRVPLENLL